MKLHTDENNLQSIKLLVASAVSGKKLQVVLHKHEDHVVPYLKSNKLPVLEVSPERFIFSSNAAVRLLLQENFAPEEETIVDRWLEWESLQLLPILLNYLVSVICHNKQESEILSQLQGCLKLLNSELKANGAFLKDKVSSADVVIWSSLFSVLTPGKTGIKDWESSYPALKSWFNKYSENQSFQQGVKSALSSLDTSVLKASLLAQPVPSLPGHILSQPGKQKQASKTKSEPMENQEESQLLSAKPVLPEELTVAKDSWQNGKLKMPRPVKRSHPILPKADQRNILITSALPYVNNVPHLGNIIGCVLSADVFSRYCRLRNYNCLYVCGTDEYGTATETKAIEEKLTPQQICDKYNKIHTEIYEWFNIDFDMFGRTTTKEQTEIAQDIFWKLYNRGFIEKDSMEQLQCQNCDKFLADRFVEGTCPLCGYDDARGDQCDACGKLINAVELKNPKCKLCSSTPVLKTSNHLFLDLPKSEANLKQHLDKVFEQGTWTHNSKVITSSWIRDGLKPRCISRDLKWGTPVPLEGYTDKVFYVWFDAPIGYISITANYTNQWEKWWKNPQNVEMYNFLGKDNVPFHSVIFPATLLGTNDNYTIVNHMIATEYLNYEDTKFSKSRGTGVFGHNAKDTGIPADIYRFYLLYVRPESQDSSFSWDDFLLKNNSELLNNLGNFINRALMFLSNNFGGIVQEMNLNDEDFKLLALINRELNAYVDNMEQARMKDSIRNILSISRLGNQYMQANKPWVLVKGSPEEKTRAACVVSLGANISCLLSIILLPFMPATSKTIQTQLNIPEDNYVVIKNFVCQLQPGHKIGQPSPLFEKIPTEKIEELKKRFAGKPAPAKKEKPCSGTSSTSGPIDKAEVDRLTAEVTKQGNVVRDLKAKKAEKSLISAEVDKLLVLKKQLAEAQGSEQPAPSGGSKKKGKTNNPPPQAVPSEGKSSKKQEGATASQEVIDRLTEEVAQQGGKVRDLKSKKAEKAVIDSEVAKLLALKKELAIAQGQDPNAAIGGGKTKGKKK